MAFEAGTVRDLLLKRMRAYGGIAFDTDWARQVLSVCERTVNAGLRICTKSTSVQTVAEQSLYWIRTDFAAALEDAIDILGIEHTDTDGTYELRRATMTDLYGYSATWFRDLDADDSGRLLWYAQIGRDLLFIYPAKPAAKTIRVIYSYQTTELVADETEMDFPEDEVPIVVDLAEIVLLGVGRLSEVVSVKLKALQEKLAAEMESRT